LVLGTPLGHPEFVAKALRTLLAGHRTLLERIPAVPDLQAAWLLLSQCANARANYYLRALPPAAAQEFAAGHDRGLWECLCSLLDILPDDPALGNAVELARLPFRLGGLGLRDAVRVAPAAH
jgi:hypothetical protein